MKGRSRFSQPLRVLRSGSKKFELRSALEKVMHELTCPGSLRRPKKREIEARATKPLALQLWHIKGIDQFQGYSNNGVQYLRRRGFESFPESRPQTCERLKPEATPSRNSGHIQVWVHLLLLLSSAVFEMVTSCEALYRSTQQK